MPTKAHFFIRVCKVTNIAMSEAPNRNIEQQPAPENRFVCPVSRQRVDPREIQLLTRHTRAEAFEVEVYRHPAENWYKVNTFYTCDCGRYLGFTVKQPINITEQNQPDRVVDLITPPPPQRPSQVENVQPAANDSIISVASSNSSSLLVELYSLPYLSDESQTPAENLPSIYDPSNSSGEPINQDVSMLSNEA